MLDQTLFNSHTKLTDYRKSVWRVVESQETAATLRVVDNMAEQDVLERLLDSAKPPYRDGTQGMHYLLKTAFRYPPLKYGSRFGLRSMPSYFYGSELLSTALCESAYYRFLFLQDMFEPYTKLIRSEHCAFRVAVASERCLDLCGNRYKAIRQSLSDPTDYSYSQAVGVWAEARGDVALIRFYSAREEKGINLAIVSPDAIRSRQPREQQQWLCLSSIDSVSFSSRESEQIYRFTIDPFSMNGALLRVVVD